MKAWLTGTFKKPDHRFTEARPKPQGCSLPLQFFNPFEFCFYWSVDLGKVMIVFVGDTNCCSMSLFGWEYSCRFRVESGREIVGVEITLSQRRLGRT